MLVVAVPTAALGPVDESVGHHRRARRVFLGVGIAVVETVLPFAGKICTPEANVIAVSTAALDAGHVPAVHAFACLVSIRFEPVRLGVPHAARVRPEGPSDELIVVAERTVAVSADRGIATLAEGRLQLLARHTRKHSTGGCMVGVGSRNPARFPLGRCPIH